MYYFMLSYVLYIYATYSLCMLREQPAMYVVGHWIPTLLFSHYSL